MLMLTLTAGHFTLSTPSGPASTSAALRRAEELDVRRVARSTASVLWSTCCITHRTVRLSLLVVVSDSSSYTSTATFITTWQLIRCIEHEHATSILMYKETYLFYSNRNCCFIRILTRDRRAASHPVVRLPVVVSGSGGIYFYNYFPHDCDNWADALTVLLKKNCTFHSCQT